MELKEEAAEYESDLTLIGSMYPYRHRLIEQLLNSSPLSGEEAGQGQHTAISGNIIGQRHTGNPEGKGYFRRGNLPEPSPPLNDINGTNSRTFDIAACKGFQLADYRATSKTFSRLEKK